MTSAIMLAKVRTHLDEATASFWTDAECYASLAHGQITCVDAIFNKYKQRFEANSEAELPQELAVLLTNVTSTGAVSSVVVPTGFFWLVNSTWDHDGTGGNEPCRVIQHNRNFFFREDNSFLSATSTDPVVYLVEIGGVLKIQWLPANSGTAAYYYNYLKYPTAIASGQEPTLPESTHNAIVEYGTYSLLMKDQRAQEAQAHLSVYNQEIQNIG